MIDIHTNDDTANKLALASKATSVAHVNKFQGGNVGLYVFCFDPEAQRESATVPEQTDTNQTASWHRQ